MNEEVKGKKSPQLRFSGFDDEWEEKKLNEYLEPSKQKNLDNKYSKNDVLSVSGEFGIVNQIEFQGRSFAGEYVNNYGVVETNDIVYTKSPLNANPYGIIKSNFGKTGIVSTLYAVYKSKNNVDPCFIQTYFDLNKRLNDYLRPLVRKGAKNDMKVSSEDALLGNVVFPSKLEQQKIGAFLFHVDTLIQAKIKKLESLKAVKKSLLQKCFPKEGEKVPEMRFAGFKGEWEEKKLGEIATKVIDKNFDLSVQEVFTNSAEFGVISQRDFFDHDIANTANIDGYYVIQNEDFVYNPRISVTAPVGPINRNNLGRKGITSPLYTLFRTKNINTLYLEWYFKTECWHDFMYLNGDSGARFDRFSIKDIVFFEMPILFPASVAEQQKIGQFFLK